MKSPLSNLVINNFEEIHGIKCKYRHDDKKCEFELNICIAAVFLNAQILRMI